jgi:phage gp46-like protein
MSGSTCGDIRIVWDPATGTGDFAMAGSALELGHELESAVLISLFTDQAADPEDLMPEAQRNDPRGWWADTYEAPDKIGSKLWQAFWRQTTPDTLSWARDQASKALQWMIDDGLARAIEVRAQFQGKGGLALQIQITEPNGKVNPFSFAWQQEG